MLIELISYGATSKRMPAWVSCSMLLLLVVSCYTTTAYAQTTAERVEKQALWVKDYKKLPILIEEIESNTLGVTKDSIRTKTELRLRQANIRPSDSASHAPPSDEYYLYVNIGLFDGAFVVQLEFQRSATWELPDGNLSRPLHLTTWSAVSFGRYGSSSTFIIEQLDGLLDKFLNAYLKANQ